MPHYACPSCHQPLDTADLNITEGVALCRGCGVLTKLADLAEQGIPSESTLTDPPDGCEAREGVDGLELRISHRSLGAAAGLLFFCVFWNGIVSVFVLIAFAGLYTNLFGPLPAWFPAPTTNQSSGSMSLGMSLFLCVFLTPFVLVGLTVFVSLLFALAGSTVVSIGAAGGRISSGVGPLRWTRRFEPASVERVVIGLSKYEVNGNKKPLIELRTNAKPIRFGSGLDEEKLKWLCAALDASLSTRR